ncbi:MAG: DHH family phosphoesterase [Patescibacteria group bacterium]
MALNSEQQALELINRAKNILVASRQHPTPDTISSAVACFLFLRNMGKNVDVVIPGFEIDKSPKFLPGLKDVKSQTGPIRAFKIYLDIDKTPLGELMYDVKDNKLEITVLPASGEWTSKDVKAKHGEDYYDLIIALDCPDMHTLGDLVKKHADFLYRTHVINIDCDSSNENWAQINIVNLNAVATCEVLYNLFTKWDKNLIDNDIATALLAGMISKTKSFRTQNITPKTLSVASELVAQGARRQEIVHGLWRTRSVSTLKLWGHALSRLNQDRELGLVWTALTKNDFVDTGAGDGDLDDVVSELVTYSPEAKVVALIYEPVKPGAICVSLHVKPPLTATALARTFGATGTNERAKFCLNENTPLVDGVNETINRLKETIRNF